MVEKLHVEEMTDLLHFMYMEHHHRGSVQGDGYVNSFIRPKLK